MKIFITGGTGSVGRAAVSRLVDAGHDLTVVGRRAGLTVSGAAYRQCDINDYPSLVEELRGFGAVVHLAAIPNPMAPGNEVFRVNDLGTFNVFQAAAENGIKRVVGASSINAVGYFYGFKNSPIRYLPVDEHHPTFATDAYSFSKQVMEDIGRYFWHRDSISNVMLRLPGVFPHERVLELQNSADSKGGAQNAFVDRLLAAGGKERRATLKRLHEAYDRYRATGVWETPRDRQKPIDSALEPEELSFMNSKANFFAYLDDTDSARVIEQSVTGNYEGSHTLFVNAHRNKLKRPVAELAELFYPEVVEVRRQYPGDDCLVSIDRARDLLGFDPVYTL